MKNNKNEREQIPFHPGKPALKDKKVRSLSEEAQNQEKNLNTEKDGRQVEKKDNAKKAVVAEHQRGKKEGKEKN